MKKKILIIDDEKDFGFLMKSYFTPRNFDVYVAYTLAEGMRMIKEEMPDIILLDNNLPDGFGWAEVEYILANYPLAQLNLISALVPKSVTTSYRILEKPLQWDELNEIMNAA